MDLLCFYNVGNIAAFKPILGEKNMDQQRKMRSGYCQDWALTKRMMYL